jgi:NAD(P)-dependent dehydrogenase (short-subunit alcohol dehydrogenase family)
LRARKTARTFTNRGSTPQAGAMHGKVVLITGANQGIGKAAAIDLARHGASVTLVARTAEKARAAVDDVRASSGSSAVESLVADLSSMAEVRRLAAAFKARHDRLDVLINNAGVFVPQRRVTAEGHEETFAVNHLAPFVLTHELGDLLRRSAPSRIVTVSSDAHRGVQMNWGDLEYAHTRYRAFRVYGQSKLANLLFTYELSRRLRGTGVTANALHPGVVATGFGQTYGGSMAVLIRMARPFLLSAEAGAKTSVYAASCPDLGGVTGQYFVRCQPARSSPESYDDVSQRKLWVLSESMADIQRPAGRAA